MCSLTVCNAGTARHESSQVSGVHDVCVGYIAANFENIKTISVCMYYSLINFETITIYKRFIACVD